MSRSSIAAVLLFIVSVIAVILAVDRYTKRPSPTGILTDYSIRLDPSAKEEKIRITATYRFNSDVDTLSISTYVSDAAFKPQIIELSRPNAPVIYPDSSFQESLSQRRKRVRIFKVPVNGSKMLRVVYTGNIELLEWNAHTGGNLGRYFGKMTRQWALFSLAQILLLPTNASLIQDLSISFALPKGWSTSLDPNSLLRSKLVRSVPGLLRDIVYSPVIVGRYNRYEFNDTRLTVLVASDKGSDSLASVAGKCNSIYKRCVSLLSIDEPEPYTIILLPVEDNGFEVRNSGTHFSLVTSYYQDELVHLKPLIREMLSRSLRVHLADSWLKDPKNRWFLVGLVEYYSYLLNRSLDQKSDPYVASNYLEGYVQDLIIDKDFVLANTNFDVHDPSTWLTVRNKAAAAIECIDAYIQRETRQEKSLESMLSTIRSVERIDNLGEWLTEFFKIEFSGFFDHYVYASEILPLDIPSKRHTSGHCLRGDSSAKDSLALIVTFEGDAYLENCGCKVNQSGGVARRAGFIKRFREAFKGPVFTISLGDEFPKSLENVVLDETSRKELQLYLSLMDEMHYDACVVGVSELLYGPEQLFSLASLVKMPFISTNVPSLSDGPVLKSHFIKRSNARILLLGITPRCEHWFFSRIWEARNPLLRFESLLSSISKELNSARLKNDDLVVVAGKVTPHVASIIADSIPRVNIIISYDNYYLSKNEMNSIQLADSSGFHGGSLVLYPYTGTYGVSAYTVYRGSNKIRCFREVNLLLRDSIQEDPRVRRIIDDFYADYAKLLDTDKTYKSQLWKNELSNHVEYVGYKRCVRCHLEQYTQWQETKHSEAFSTLLRARRQFNPKCLICHVTGYGWESGFEREGTNLGMSNVQCEVCHGPGSQHVLKPLRFQLRRKPSRNLCFVCHEPAHSNMNPMNFSNYISRVRH